MHPQFVGPTFTNDGGPLLAISRHLLPGWRGAPRTDPVGGDYGRAIATGGLASVVKVGAETGFAIGNEEHVSPGRWIQWGDSWVLAACLVGNDDSDQKLLKALGGGKALDWRRLASNVPVKDGLTLMHAASAGADFAADRAQPSSTSTKSGIVLRSGGPRRSEFVGIGDAVVAPVRDGNYHVERAFYKVVDEAEFVLLRWVPGT